MAGKRPKHKKREQTIDQKIAEKEAQVRRLKQRREQAENGRKIITGSLVIEAARRDPDTRRWLRGLYEQYLSRKTDRERIQPWYDELHRLDDLESIDLAAALTDRPEPVNQDDDEQAPTPDQDPGNQDEQQGSGGVAPEGDVKIENEIANDLEAQDDRAEAREEQRRRYADFHGAPVNRDDQQE